MDNQPRVSVVLPVYNASRYLSIAVESILAQTLREFELIAIDDGSTDNSLDILRRFERRDARVRIITRPNTGMAVALNEGISCARAEYIARMDADDISLPARLERQLEFMERHPECMAAGTSFRFIDPWGRAIGIHHAEPNPDRLREILLTHSDIVLAHPSAMLRRDALEQVGGYRPEFRRSQDYDLWLRLDEIGKLGNLTDVLMEYRLHLSSVTYTERPIQLGFAYRAIAEAYERRKLTSDPPSLTDEQKAISVVSSEDILREWWFRAHGHGATAAAISYALQLVRRQPFHTMHWSMLSESTLGKRGTALVRAAYRSIRRVTDVRLPLSNVTLNGHGQARKRPRLLFVLPSDGTGGDTQFWIDLVADERFRMAFDCHLLLNDTSAHRRISSNFERKGVFATFYGGRLSRLERSLSRLSPRLARAVMFRLNRMRKSWGGDFGLIKHLAPEIVWFNLGGVEYPQLYPEINGCLAAEIPYWYVSHNVPNDMLFMNDEHEREVTNVIASATRFAVNSIAGGRIVERALAKSLDNLFVYPVAKPHEFLVSASKVAQCSPIRTEGSARFVHVGSLHPWWKGHHVLFETLSNTKWANRDWTLVCYGNGPAQSYLERLIAHFCLTDRVYLAGRTENVLEALADCDLFVFPSITEGKPLALTEAMACGRPAVGTAVGGIPELIIDGDTGWLARSPTAKEFGEALERAWANRARWESIGIRAMNHVRANYDQDDTIPLLIAEIQADLSIHKTDSKDEGKRRPLNRKVLPMARNSMTPETLSYGIE